MKQDVTRLISIILVILGMTTGAFVYAQNTYVNKDSFSMLLDRLSKIETKLDRLVERR